MDNFNLLNGVWLSIFSMLVVFIVLIILALIISLISKVLYKPEVIHTTSSVESIEMNEEELLVVKIISGILMQEEKVTDVVIKSIKKVGGSIWVNIK